MIEIGSAKNGEFKRLLKLKNAAAARKEGVFLLEGERAVLELPPEWETESLWMASSYHGKLLVRLPERVFRLPDDPVLRRPYWSYLTYWSTRLLIHRSETPLKIRKRPTRRTMVEAMPKAWLTRIVPMKMVATAARSETHQFL